MRVTRDTLLKVARDTAAQRVKVSRRLVCIYLTGSVLGDDALLGGSTDIDLIIVHDSEPVQEREVVRLSEDIHLDIGHYAQSVFQHPRQLRTDPWLGPFIYSKPLVLHDTQHWFDYIQAATGAQFNQPDYVSQRGQTLAQLARQAWMNMQFNDAGNHPQNIYTYLKALENAGNAIASLTGDPLPERRFMLKFPQRALAIDKPDLSTHLIAMLMDPALQVDAHWNEWLPAWKDTFLAAGKHGSPAPARLHSSRFNYYERAVSTLFSDHPAAALWMMLRTWTEAVLHLPPDSPQMTAWVSFCDQLKLDEASFENRLAGLDAYLDSVEEALDEWAANNGVSALLE
jgi:hypothetical protein